MVIERAATDGRDLVQHSSWIQIKEACTTLQSLQAKDGSILAAKHHSVARRAVGSLIEAIAELVPFFPHDEDYLTRVIADSRSWEASGFGVPDFYESLSLFHPERTRVDGTAHLVVFPMYTQNGSTNRYFEAVLCETIWPDFVASLESGDYSNALFVPLRFLDYTPGYDTNSAVLFPESVAVTPRVPEGSPDGTPAALPPFTWGGIFADREAARFRSVVRHAVDITHLELPSDAQALLDDPGLCEKTFVMWDLIHDRTHMRGDLPFDPFMIKQRMPFYLYGLEELRCDLTAFREAVSLLRAKKTDSITRKHAQLVLYAVVFDRIFRFPLSGTRVRNYDSVAGQLLFAWLHQHSVLHWTDTQLTLDWDAMPDVVVALSDRINELYWRSIDRPKIVHWLAAHDLIAGVLAPHPASHFLAGSVPLDGAPADITDHVHDDEFPLSMFYEALGKKLAPTIAATAGITGLVAQS
ncbi:MAG: DUF6421 family protein [Pontimonas sp.]|nr:DUF6421 family protein [Pontimonas sp.]